MSRLELVNFQWPEYFFQVQFSYFRSCSYSIKINEIEREEFVPSKGFRKRTDQDRDYLRYRLKTSSRLRSDKFLSESRQNSRSRILTRHERTALLLEVFKVVDED